ncbi:MAG TPA: BlaI/MecI/CopY family transcriptional regulator [Planctomycetaceae bacterium]|nr:BlaI/MecI/CopY family transcriptional regulator [Planctomycetaceae bacterium]
MPRTPQDVTDAELSILHALWDRGPQTVRQLTDQLYPEGTGSQYATVQKLLDRLEGKACVTRDREVWPHVFQATIAREELIGRRLQATADKLCDGSLTPLLTHLVSSSQLTADERKSLRSLLDELGKATGEG